MIILVLKNETELEKLKIVATRVISKRSYLAAQLTCNATSSGLTYSTERNRFSDKQK